MYGLMNTITKTDTKNKNKKKNEKYESVFFHAVYHSKKYVIPHSVIVAISDVILNI